MTFANMAPRPNTAVHTLWDKTWTDEDGILRHDRITFTTSRWFIYDVGAPGYWFVNSPPRTERVHPMAIRKFIPVPSKYRRYYSYQRARQTGPSSDGHVYEYVRYDLHSRVFLILPAVCFILLFAFRNVRNAWRAAGTLLLQIAKPPPATGRTGGFPVIVKRDASS